MRDFEYVLGEYCYFGRIIRTRFIGRVRGESRRSADDCGVDKDDPLALFRGFYGEVLGLWEACLRGRTLADYKARGFD